MLRVRHDEEKPVGRATGHGVVSGGLGAGDFGLEHCFLEAAGAVAATAMGVCEVRALDAAERKHVEPPVFWKSAKMLSFSWTLYVSRVC